MCQYWAKEGMPSDWHLVHLGSRAVGGAGLIIAEATGVEARGRITPGCTGIWSDEHIEPWARVAKFISENGSVPGIQIGHAGRKANTLQPWIRGDHDTPTGDATWDVVGPSPIPFRQGSNIPRELTLEDIRIIQESFRTATIRAQRAGFRWLEFHSAHGYLSYSFLSPLSNHRTDAYGGSFENRTRFTLETAKIMRETWPENLPLAVRLSCTDWVEGGWTLDDSIRLAGLLKSTGVDLIDCSSGFGSSGVSYPFGPGWQVPLSERLRREAGIPTAAVGQITQATHADEIIRNGRADLVLLGRESLRDPYWPFHASVALGRPDAIKLPAPYDYAVR
jgi:2,4-dienoyl-CoA reductase-like NADH-dependent reductase (Old Yellow Enzyme family)